MPSASSANSTTGAESTTVRSWYSDICSAALVLRSSVTSISTPCENSTFPRLSRTMFSLSQTWSTEPSDAISRYSRSTSTSSRVQRSSSATTQSWSSGWITRP